MTDINIKEGYYHYTVGFNDVGFAIDVELYLSAGEITAAIDEAFEGDFVDISELSTVTSIDIVNYSEEMWKGIGS